MQKPYVRKRTAVCYVQTEEVSLDFFDGNLAGQHASHYGGNWNSGARQRLTASLFRADDVDGINGGLQSPAAQSRSLASNRNRIRKAIQPVPNAYEDALKLLAA